MICKTEGTTSKFMFWITGAAVNQVIRKKTQFGGEQYELICELVKFGILVWNSGGSWIWKYKAGFKCYQHEHDI